MARQGPEARRIASMKKKAAAIYGSRLVIVKQHGNEFTEAGVSDLLCCLDGVFVAAEAKAAKSYGGSEERAREKGPSVKQRLFIERVRKAGGVAAVVVTDEDFLALLREAEAVLRYVELQRKDEGP